MALKVVNLGNAPARTSAREQYLRTAVYSWVIDPATPHAIEKTVNIAPAVKIKGFRRKISLILAKIIRKPRSKVSCFVTK